MKYATLTLLALLAFAGNSILCRLALNNGAIDAASFTAIRLISGAVVLLLLLKLKEKKQATVTRGSWVASLMLFIYAIGFSYAYVSLETGTGALILFTSVQISLLGIGWIKGHRLCSIEWLGILVAFAGFIYLILPGVGAPSPVGFILMTLSGVAWSIYTYLGNQSTQPLADTAYNFLRTTPLVVLLLLLTISGSSITTEGILLAVLSGVLASGIGYTIWYMALSKINVTQAAVAQLLVPVIASLAGVIFANEAFTLRLVVASLFIIGGMLTVILGKRLFDNKAMKS